MATMQFPSILQYEGPQLDVGGNFAQGMQTGILRQQNERAQAEEGRAQTEFAQKQSDREKMQGILESMGPDATPEEIANSLLAVDPEMANKYMDLAIDKESLASERLGQQTERLRQQSVNFDLISQKQARDREIYKEQKITATAWSKNFADTLSGIIDPVEKKKAQEALIKSAEADNQNRAKMGLKPIELPDVIKSGDPDKAVAFAQEIATIGQQQVDMMRKVEMAGLDPTAEIQNYEYGLDKSDFFTKQQGSAPASMQVASALTELRKNAQNAEKSGDIAAAEESWKEYNELYQAGKLGDKGMEVGSEGVSSAPGYEEFLARKKSSESFGTAQGAAIFDLPRVRSVAAEAVTAIDNAISSPGLENITGWMSLVPVTPGGERARAEAVLDQVQGRQFLAAYETLKGGGQITEVEGKKGEDAIASLGRSQNKEDVTKALNDLRGVIIRSVKAKEEAATKTQKEITGESFSAPQKYTAESPAKPVTDEEYNALPEGSHFIDPDDGKTYVK